MGYSVYVVFLAGGIASGKSSVARKLRSLGACCIDLDQLSREATAAGSPALQSIAEAFGSDVLNGNGELRRNVLAQRAFLSQDRTRLLESIVHPRIRELLFAWLKQQDKTAVCVVEIPLLDRTEDLLPTANEVMCVLCPLETRRERAIGRGMTGEDFDARVRMQPTDDYLASKATTLIRNDGDEQELKQEVTQWWLKHCEGGNAGTAIG